MRCAICGGFFAAGGFMYAWKECGDNHEYVCGECEPIIREQLKGA